ncbi:MAG: hypothetical protein ACTSQJ_19535 [Promethearchaeota archaeon]
MSASAFCLSNPVISGFAFKLSGIALQLTVPSAATAFWKAAFILESVNADLRISVKFIYLYSSVIIYCLF